MIASGCPQEPVQNTCRLSQHNTFGAGQRLSQVTQVWLLLIRLLLFQWNVIKMKQLVSHVIDNPGKSTVSDKSNISELMIKSIELPEVLEVSPELDLTFPQEGVSDLDLGSWRSEFLVCFWEEPLNFWKRWVVFAALLAFADSMLSNLLLDIILFANNPVEKSKVHQVSHNNNSNRSWASPDVLIVYKNDAAMSNTIHNIAEKSSHLLIAGDLDT